MVNLAGWQSRVAESEALAPANPFAVIVLAQLECRATEPDASRLASKFRLASALRQWNHDQAVRRQVFRIIDSLLSLPPELARRFIELLEEREKPAMLQQLSSIDRYLLAKERVAGLENGRRKERREGKMEGAAESLSMPITHKFDALPDWVHLHLEQADEAI